MRTTPRIRGISVDPLRPPPRRSAAALRRAGCTLLLAAVGASAGRAQDSADWPDLAALGRIEVVAVTRRPQPAWASAAALAVVTADDIRRSGARTLPETLRLAPGLNVAQIDARNWAVSARGFNAQYANKLLVLVDGRSVYTPFFGGVYWDAQDMVLDDIERIEVVRGPGAALWGANAVNGVINVVTRPARDTTGGLVQAEAAADQSAVALRWGAPAGRHWAWRVDAKAADFRSTDSLTFGGRAGDAWRSLRAGFRADYTPDAATSAMVKVDAYGLDGDYAQFVAGRTIPGFAAIDRAAGIAGNGAGVQARWERREPSGDGELAQVWAEHTWRRNAIFREQRNTIAVDLQRSRARGRHTVTWGLGYQHSSDEIGATPMARTEPSRFHAHLVSAFAQSEVAVVPDRLDLVGGLRLEHNAFTGWELQPGLRGVWRPGDAHALWAGISRAVRSPSRFEDAAIGTAGVLPAGTLGEGTPPALIEWRGSSGFRSEVVIAWEAGWRAQPAASVTFDATVFLHDYTRLQDILPSAAPAPVDTPSGPALVWPWHYVNTLDGRSRGVETVVTWQPAPGLRVCGGYVHTAIDQSGPPGGLDEFYFENSTPRHAAFLRAGWSPASAWEVDVALRANSALPAVAVPGYAAVDARLAWHPRAGLTLELFGRNLTDPVHPEFRDGAITQIAGLRRGAGVRLTWRH